ALRSLAREGASGWLARWQLCRSRSVGKFRKSLALAAVDPAVSACAQRRMCRRIIGTIEEPGTWAALQQNYRNCRRTGHLARLLPNPRGEPSRAELPGAPAQDDA